MNVSQKILPFLKHLEIKAQLPDGVQVLNPYRDKYTFQLCKQFYSKYYDDTAERFLIIGINPGRFGGGLTGIPFTDPKKLEVNCTIPNSLTKKSELSADFIYQVIDGFGGPEKFFARFYFS